MNIKDIISSSQFKLKNPTWTKQDLSEADLSEANLRWADLSGADLSGANLRGANLRGANLREANLRGANLRWANLHGADLSGANLSEANLRLANLSEANLRLANLRLANLSGANLSEANLSEANLRWANLSGAELSGALHVPYHPESLIVCEGSIIGWKKTREGIAELLIPEKAKRSNATSRKCRAEYAIVLDLPEGILVAHSVHDPSFIYRKGDKVAPREPFDENRWNECGSGIHFFITKHEAEQY